MAFAVLVSGRSSLAGAAGVAGEQCPSFPSAEGFGAVAKGGRGGRLVKDANLRAEGPESLQAAGREKGPRIIVFDVGGVVEGDVMIEPGDLCLIRWRS